VVNPSYEDFRLTYQLSPPMKHNIHNPFTPNAGGRLAIVFATILSGICLDATAITWDGGSGGTNNWIGGSGSNSGQRNWDTNNALVANDPLVFAGTTRLTPNNNTTANTNYNGITFNSGAGAFTLGGNAITLGGNVVNNSTNLQTINMNLILSGSRTCNASTGNLAVGGLISESGAGVGALVKTGSFTLTPTNQNTYAGGTTITAGTLALGHATNTLADTVGSVKIFDFEGYSGNFTSVLPTGLASGFTATFDQTNGIVTVVPEPKAAFLGSLGMLALLRRRRY
jgi:autotransporter-associated beta strand protein